MKKPLETVFDCRDQLTFWRSGKRAVWNTKGKTESNSLEKTTGATGIKEQMATASEHTQITMENNKETTRKGLAQACTSSELGSSVLKNIRCRKTAHPKPAPRVHPALGWTSGIQKGDLWPVSSSLYSHSTAEQFQSLIVSRLRFRNAVFVT